VSEPLVPRDEARAVLEPGESWAWTTRTSSPSAPSRSRPVGSSTGVARR